VGERPVWLAAKRFPLLPPRIRERASIATRFHACWRVADARRSVDTVKHGRSLACRTRVVGRPCPRAFCVGCVLGLCVFGGMCGVGRSRRARWSRGRAGVVPISRPCLSFVSSGRAWVEALFGRRHPGALAASKRRAIRVVLRGLRIRACLGAGVVCARLLSARLLHLLPCREDIRPRLGVLLPCVWLLRSGRSTEVLVREAVGASVVGGILLWWGRRGRRWSGLGRGRAVVRAALRRGRVCVARRRRRSGSGRVGRVVGHVLAAVLPALGVVLCSLQLVAENLMCRLDFLELDDKLRLAPRVAVWVVLQRECSEGLSDLALAGVGGHFEVRIVVPRGIGFGHGGGGAWAAGGGRWL
jgi:hypothetical protein